MKIFFEITKIILEILSDLEFKVFDSSFSCWKPFRFLYIKHMRIQNSGSYRIGHNLYIKNKGNLSLGERCCIGSFSKIWNYAPINVGDDFIAAGNLCINSATHDPDTLDPKGLPIYIGSNVWCGINVTILAGVTIGNNVVIGAGSIVIKDIPDNCLAVGIPAKPIRKIDRKDTILWCPFRTD